MTLDKKKILCTLFLGIVLLIPCQLWAEKVSVEVIHSSDKYHAGEDYPILFRINIPEGWYIHSNGDGLGGLIPTSLTFNNSDSLIIKDIQFPDPVEKSFEYLAEPVDIFSGEILVSAVILLSHDSPLGTQTIQGRLSYQACSINACRPPQDLPIELSLYVVPQDTPGTEINNDLFLTIKNNTDKIKKGIDTFWSDRGFFLTLALIFMGGLAMNLSPCIYPLIPVTVSYFGGESGKMKGVTLIHGIMYLFGLSVTNSTMGVTSALSGNMIGAVLQQPAALVAIALIMTILGLSFFDLWEIRLPPALNNIASKNFSGYFGTFFMGLTIGIIAAPCIGPFILGLFTYVGQKGDPFFGFLCFFILSIGMGLPLFILAMFSGAIKRLPMPGDWMLWIRRLMGWVLIGMAVYMLSPLTSGTIGKPALFLAVGVAAGVHLGWLDRSGRDRGHFVFVKRIIGVLIILLAIGYFYSAVSNKGGIKWSPYDEVLLSNAVQEGKPVILDFYADWCVPCKGLDETVFKDPEVADLSNSFVVIRLDLTTQKPIQDEILERYQVIGVPTIIFLNKEGKEERSLRVESMVNKSQFLSAMRQVLLVKP